MIQTFNRSTLAVAAATGGHLEAALNPHVDSAPNFVGENLIAIVTVRLVRGWLTTK